MNALAALLITAGTLVAIPALIDVEKVNGLDALAAVLVIAGIVIQTTYPSGPRQGRPR